MFSMCSELTPCARIPDTRIPQFMQPCQMDEFANWLYLYENAIAIECCQSTICWSKSRWMGQGDMMGLQGCAAYRRICQTHLWPICSLHHKPAFETMVRHTSGTTTWEKSKSCKKSSVSNFNLYYMNLSI